MKLQNRIHSGGLSLLASVLVIGTSSAATILTSDFSGTTKSGTTMSGITWTTVGIVAPGPALTVDNTIQSAGSGNLFTTAAATGVIAPANNTSNGGEWNVVADFTTLADPIELDDFELTYIHFNGGGAFQNVTRDANYTVEIRDSGGAVLGGSTINTDNINTNPGASGPQTITFDLSSVTLAANTDYTLFVEAAQGDGPAGNNTGFDEFVLNGTVIPEPSSALLIGLASSMCLLRRRKK